MFLRIALDNCSAEVLVSTEKIPMTLVGIEPGPLGYKSNALPLRQRVYSLTQLSEIRYKPISYASGRVIGRNTLLFKVDIIYDDLKAISAQN